MKLSGTGVVFGGRSDYHDRIAEVTYDMVAVERAGTSRPALIGSVVFPADMVELNRYAPLFLRFDNDQWARIDLPPQLSDGRVYTLGEGSEIILRPEWASTLDS